MKFNLNEFIFNSNIAHNHKYDYSLVNYKKSNKKILIICPIHGQFEQLPNDHKIGRGCRECANATIKIKNLSNTKRFISKAKIKHKDKYNYSKTEYINYNTAVIIICPEHGEFLQQPTYHLNSKGCLKCVNERMSKLYCKSDEKFILEANNVHNNKYYYHSCEYKGNKIPVKIICKQHGEFEVTPLDHLYKKCGCPICNGFGKVSEPKLFNIIKDYFPNTEVITQAKFNWLGKQSVDIFLPQFNIAIEYQGGLHFVSKKYFGGDKALRETIQRDIRKNILCVENNIELLYFTYEVQLIPDDYYFKIISDEKELLHKIKTIIEYKRTDNHLLII